MTQKLITTFRIDVPSFSEMKLDANEIFNDEGNYSIVLCSNALSDCSIFPLGWCHSALDLHVCLEEIGSICDFYIRHASSIEIKTPLFTQIKYFSVSTQ